MMTDVKERWSLIDAVELKDSREDFLLTEDDICLYYLTRTRGDFTKSKANSRISNFKRDPEQYKDRPDVWAYKTNEIEKFAEEASDFLAQPNFQQVLDLFQNPAIVPMPTSKPKTHEHFDSRLEDLCLRIQATIGRVSYANPFDLKDTLMPAHLGGSRKVTVLKENITFGEFPKPTLDLIILVDDVLTTGAHFVACKEILQSHHPALVVMGLFLSLHRSDFAEYEYHNIKIEI